MKIDKVLLFGKSRLQTNRQTHSTDYIISTFRRVNKLYENCTQMID